jgi:hypothetical protein
MDHPMKFVLFLLCTQCLPSWTSCHATNSIRVTPWSCILQYSIHGPAHFFHSHFSIEVVLHEMYFFSLNNRNAIAFESHPALLPLHNVTQYDLTAQQYSAIDLTGGGQEVAPLLQHSESSITHSRITSKQVQNMVLHLQHWRCILTTNIPVDFLLFSIAIVRGYSFSSS